MTADEGKTQDEPRFPLDYHRENARQLYGVTKHVVTGAASGQRAKTFTVTQMKQLIKDHTDPRKSPVTAVPGQADPGQEE